MTLSFLTYAYKVCYSVDKIGYNIQIYEIQEKKNSDFFPQNRGTRYKQQKPYLQFQAFTDYLATYIPRVNTDNYIGIYILLSFKVIRNYYQYLRIL